MEEHNITGPSLLYTELRSQSCDLEDEEMAGSSVVDDDFMLLSQSSNGCDTFQSSTHLNTDSPFTLTTGEDMDTPSTSTANPSTGPSDAFHVQTHLIPQAEEQNELQGLGLNVYNQEDLEQGIIAQVDEVLAKQEEQRIKKLLERQLKSVLDDVSSSRQELVRIGQIIRSLTRCSGELSKENRKQLEAATRQRENKLKQMKKLKAKQAALLAKLDGQDIDPDLASNDEDLKFFNQALSTDTPKETEAEILVKRGEMTPFGTVMKEKSKVQSQPKPIVQPSAPSEFELFLQNKDTVTSKKGKTLKNKSNSFTKCTQQSPTLSKLNQFDLDSPVKHSLKHKRKEISKQKLKPKSAIKRKPSLVKEGSVSNGHISDKDWAPSDGEDGEWKPSSDEDSVTPHKKKKLGVNGVKDKSILEEEELGVIKGNNSVVSSVSRTRDDGNLAFFQKRLKSSRKLEAARKKKQRDEGLSDSEDDEMEFEGGLKVPGTLWNKLYGYQRTGVKWLWELHCQQAGGIVGDEMGLGKTIQTISFLASLKTSKLKQRPFRYVGLGPTIIVCPATVMHQWVREFHKWWPEFRVAVLHSSGTHTGSEDHLIHNIVNQHGVLVTSYTTLVHQQDALLHHDWHYIILDEGHKIRNPDAQVTQAVKQFRTPHRIILSGSPIQNNLKELWSLFDFVFPGKLGTLPDFMAHFSIPIVQGGYANASQVQVQTAYKCACILRDTISPYLLRRMKADVKSSVNLPGKSEQVLFCRLTDEQRDVYQEYLESKECNAILAGKYKVFAGLITLRKICNHPDISTGGPRILVGQSTNGDPTREYGYWRRSGKLIVVEALLKIWKQQGHRVLLFSQSKQMLDILEGFVKECDYSYLRMDGGTSISARQPLIQKYNSNPTIFVFLLTTRVGGLGVNLTGANRVVIFDPDWNPSTDMQARERAWRIGQNKQVTIYRLLTTGSIEEKIYHRQIFKQFLTNRVLKDPKQRRFFKTNDLFELFTLGDKDDKNGTETEAIFAGTGSEVTVGKNKNRFDEMKKEAIPVNKKVDQIDSVDVERKQKMKEMAKKLSEKIVKDKDNGHTSGKKKKKKKRDKRPKDAEFEGSKIPHLTKLSDHKTSGKDGNADEQLSVQQDDYVLKKLFKKTGIQGALQHDVIVSADKMDYALVEGEAEKVAREAVSALKKSRRHCHTAVSGIPNFTGAPSRPRFGKKKNSLLVDPSKQAVKPLVNGETDEKSADQKVFDGSLAGNRTGVSLVSSSTRVVMTSEELLGKMRARQISSEDDVAPTPKNGDNKDIELVTEIRNFIAFQCHVDGQASTQELLDEFGVKLPPGESAKFKAMLNQICDFYRSGDAGVWKLKPAFR